MSINTLLCNKKIMDGVAAYVNNIPQTENELYVAKNGNDLTGNGSILRPYLTIQHAINQTITKTTNTIIHVGAGSYTENLGISNGYIHFVSSLAEINDVNEVVVINGNILINISTGIDNLYNRNVSFTGIQIKGLVQDFSSKQHSLILQSCYIYNSPTCIFFNTNPAILRLTDCEISQVNSSGTGNLVNIWGGEVHIDSTDFYCKNTYHTLSIEAFGRLARCNLCQFSSSNSTPSSLINISNNSINVLSLNTFVFTDTSPKTNSAGAYAIYSDSLVGNTTLTLLNGVFILTGLPSTQKCISGNIDILYAELFSIPLLASTISVSGTKTQLTQVS